MAEYPWGDKKERKKRNDWLKEQKLWTSFRAIVKTGKTEAEALDLVMDDFMQVRGEGKTEDVIHGITKTDYLWAFEHLADDEDEITKDQAPSKMAWSLLMNAKSDPSMARNIEARIGKDLFGGDEDDDDSRAFVKSGTAQTLRQRFSGFLGEAKQLLSRELPRSMGCTEG
jgi:hypothetical protein